ncbi:MAG: EAL domain-containing protein [Leptospiraceae bacterium]|nr:EAL domain-containing protein [Leptospiraceae bacterium]
MDIEEQNVDNSPELQPREDADHFLGLQDLISFKNTFIDTNRGKPLYLVRVEELQGIELLAFVERFREFIARSDTLCEMEYAFHFIDKERCLLTGFSPIRTIDGSTFPNMDNAIGRFHERSLREEACSFNFGIARTQCNYISSIDEIFEVLDQSARQNLKDNLVRWSWTIFNKANSYFSTNADEAVIQPTVYFDEKAQIFSVKGGEVFVGGSTYEGYQDLINDIPADQDMDRIELLILEKLIIACQNAPGVLKFNISPQTLLDTFRIHERVVRFNRLLHANGLDPQRITLELVEKSYEESNEKGLKDVCEDFFQYGITFAADDFGVKSQSHQVILTLGQMIKEFKLDPISFKFKPDEDKTKFLDNMAFIAYCKRLADNREANITAEAVEDLETLNFLLEHKIKQYQAFIFCRKMPINEYRIRFGQMQGLPHSIVQQILGNAELRQVQLDTGNIFTTAIEAGLWSMT